MNFYLYFAFRCGSGYYSLNDTCLTCDESCKECDGPSSFDC